MQIRTRMCTSLDGYVTTPDGWPVQLADPAFQAGERYGFPAFQKTLDSVLMGRTTFEPAIGNERWPWPGLDVFVLGSDRPEGTPDHVVFDGDPSRLLEHVRAADRGGDCHLVGGPQTVETYRALGALDTLGLIVLPMLTGEGMQLTPSLNTGAALTFEAQKALPGGAVELTYRL